VENEKLGDASSACYGMMSFVMITVPIKIVLPAPSNRAAVDSRSILDESPTIALGDGMDGAIVCAVRH
jgi:hypothetical protein